MDMGDDMDRQATLALYRDQPGYAIDLNGDGQNEYICEPTWIIDAKGQKSVIRGATGNGRGWVLAKQNGHWIEIGQVDGKAARVLDTSTNGWRDIENYNDGGDVNHQYIFQYDNGRYRAKKIGEYRHTSH